MFLLSMFGIGIILVCLLTVWIEDVFTLKAKLYSSCVCAVLILICVWIFNYDVNSPVKIREYIIETNDIEKYTGIKCDKKKRFILKETVITPTRFGAIYNEKTEYVILGN